ncbi:hypothetical protein conserved [Leishmania donovani]|uniref:Uncharacterized protein n=3 Tax=Leishmania donovani species complex TaxID=38574 RepID=A4I6Z1_LEIIN|nr:hypothetical protein, unknown function [Leishmania infantum JPCM5]TPP41406.1 hypothetical protein CGC20_3080 [Leishmania donovani]CAC9520390.1 hypothetical_protein_-_conserved [Leishmania infantum]CAJ1991415.1 hypothetical protein conserved [Leishmania donovani]CAM70568.1 hypothetical protein, unknown function [Leishmania infantum JPCM5]SUZ44445.1 hypothetical_protein_-_conserved [Leishmania infantum]|eukprot:XP_001467510.1 hypothetical protein, unknown function [Leishmania infantum JPCM5]
MDTAPTTLFVVLHNKQRYAIPVNAAGIQVGPPVLYPNPNRRKRGGYGPGTVDGSSLSRPPLSSVSESTDSRLSSTSESTTLHRSSRSRSDCSVCFTDAPAEDVNDGDLVQFSTAAALWLQLPQPSILRKSSGLLHALPPLFDFDYKSPHTPRQSPTELKQHLPASSVNSQGDEKGAESAKQEHCCTFCPRVSSAAAVAHRHLFSPPAAHRPPSNNSDPALRFVMHGDIGDAAAVSRMVHQLPMSEATHVEHSLGGGSEATAKAAPSTPKQPPAVMSKSTAASAPRPPQSLLAALEARSMQTVASDGPYGPTHASYRRIIPEYQTDKAEGTASQGNGRDEATPTAPTARKPLKHPPRIKGESTARIPRTQAAVVEDDKASRIASDLTQGSYSIYCMPSLNILTPTSREDNSCDMSLLPMHDAVAGKEPIHREVQLSEMECLMDRYFYGGQPSSAAGDVRSISPLDNYEEGMESSAIWKPQPPHIDDKATPQSQQSTVVPKGTPENVLSLPRDAAYADYEYVNPSTPITVSVFAAPSPLSVEGFSRTSLYGGQHAAARALPSREAHNSIRERGRYAMLTLLRRFASTGHLKPKPAVAAEESTVSADFESNEHGKPMVSEWPSSTEALTSLTTASSTDTSCSENESLRSTSVSDFEEDDEDAVEMVNSVESQSLSSPEKSPSPPQSSKGVKNGHQWRWSSIRERLMRPLIPVPSDIKEPRLPSLQKWYRAKIKAKVKEALQSGRASDSSATLDPLYLYDRPKKTIK